jgi:MYXO-CTERM domain-containing protein
MMMGASFNLNFEGADESLDVHSVYIPIEDDVPWHIEMILLEGYEVKSCEGCEDLEIDGNRANFHSNEPVMVMFGKAATTEECDQTVTIGEGGYSFEPAEITISVGDTVCWIWENTADVHNVVEIISEFDDNLNLTEAAIGFESGVPAISVDFRHTFTEDDKTHNYVCEPHATMGMVGKVTVGQGSADDKVPDVLEESGLPNISFVVGALVLVGAAGLRRRTH